MTRLVELTGAARFSGSRFNWGSLWVFLLVYLIELRTPFLVR
jgi:hypothetical protein